MRWTPNAPRPIRVEPQLITAAEHRQAWLDVRPLLVKAVLKLIGLVMVIAALSLVL